LSLRDDLAVLTPRLRRYAQGLCNAAQASNETADALVQQTLRHALETGSLNPRSNVTIWVYALLTQFHREADSRLRGMNAASDGHRVLSQTQAQQPIVQNGYPGGFGGVLATLSLEEREALLLVALEGFTYAQASSILRISRAIFVARLGQARTALVKAMTPLPLPTLRRQAPHLRIVK
jgi:RNA polymerase sigma-70 factor (ECF subfamily)